MSLLNVNNLTVSIEDDENLKEILHGVNIEINKGETHVLMGPNGAGKSTLGYALMGNPRYITEGGEIIFDGKNIVDESADKRAKAGMFLSFQNPLEVPGLPLSSFIRNAVEAVSGKRVRMMQFKKDLEKNMEVLNMDKDYANRALNVGFSGGEKKRNEIFQMAMLEPKVAILDETDSGLDIDALRIVANGVNKLKNENNAVLVITHYQRLLDYIVPDYVHVLSDGKIVKTGDKNLALELEAKGYDWLKG